MKSPSVVTLKTRTSLVLVAGIAIREVFSFWTGHPFDFELWVRTGFWVAHGVSPYGVLGPVPGLSFSYIFSASGESTIAYLPFWPLLLGGIYDLYSLVGGGDRFVYYFLLKQPEILGDVLLGYFISRCVKAVRPDFANKALALWLMSPFTIIISGIWGMFDSLAMLPVVMALDSKKESTSALLEGLAIWIKSIPLVFAVPIAFSGQNKLRNLAYAILLPVAATLATIVILRWPVATAFATLQSTVGKGGQSLSAVGFAYYLIEFNAIGPVSSLELYAVRYVWIPAELIAIYLGYRWYGYSTRRGLVQSLLLCTITFLLFKAQVNEQYGIYVLALALVDLSWNPSRKWLYVSLTAADMTFLLVNNVFLVRFLSPVYPDWSLTEAMLSRMMGPWTLRLELASSIAFVLLNVVYFVLIFRSRSSVPQRTT
ncbi:MAG: hypothetical protein JRN09_06865 [Nitrososphaerota archaeon]|nr:hypothetical protein [Nitrososphaerota archaeon]